MQNDVAEKERTAKEQAAAAEKRSNLRTRFEKACVDKNGKSLLDEFNHADILNGYSITPKIAFYRFWNKRQQNYKGEQENEIAEGESRKTNEFKDIFPALREYQQAKEDYRRHRITQDGVNHQLRRLVVEVNEFLVVLRSNTTSEDERQILNDIRFC